MVRPAPTCTASETPPSRVRQLARAFDQAIELARQVPRVMLQVRLDDVVQTDQIFAILMGDQVEPRREFIETNALNGKNLDI